MAALGSASRTDLEDDPTMHRVFAASLECESVYCIELHPAASSTGTPISLLRVSLTTQMLLDVCAEVFHERGTRAWKAKGATDRVVTTPLFMLQDCWINSERPRERKNSTNHQYPSTRLKSPLIFLHGSD